MHQPTEDHRTAKDLSPEELAEYRRKLDQHFKNRKVDEALLQRAWHTAHRVAAMLYEDFGATQVAVFGSLAGQKWFSKGSDIDIAVWGLPGDTYLNALWETRNFSPEFKIDLVNFHSAKGRFRERIQSQAIRVQRGETDCSSQTIRTEREEMDDEMDNRELIERIADERGKIERTVEEIKVRLKKWKRHLLKIWKISKIWSPCVFRYSTWDWRTFSNGSLKKLTWMNRKEKIGTQTYYNKCQRHAHRVHLWFLKKQPTL